MKLEDLNLNAVLRAKFLGYVNDYLTIEKFAEHNEISEADAVVIIELGRKYHERYVTALKS